MAWIGRPIARWVVQTTYPSGSPLLPILMYHRVLPEPDPLQPEVPHQAMLAEHFKALASAFNVLPLNDAARMLHEGTLPQGAACITFDDGYRDNHDLALPLLRQYGLPATIFVATGYLNGGIMFNDAVVETVRRLDTGEVDLSHIGLGRRTVSDVASRRALIAEITKTIKYLSQAERDAFCPDLCERAGLKLPRDLMLDDHQVHALAAAGIDIGGHTVSHPILTTLKPEEVRREIVTNNAQITALTGRPPVCFAYPNGKPNLDYSAAHAKIVADCGFETAVSTAVGVATDKSDRFQLPRFMPRERSVAQFVARMLRMATHKNAQLAS